jgi:hypothetical protein
VTLDPGVEVISQNAQSKLATLDAHSRYQWRIKSPDADPFMIVKPNVRPYHGAAWPCGASVRMESFSPFLDARQNQKHGRALSIHWRALLFIGSGG